MNRRTHKRTRRDHYTEKNKVKQTKLHPRRNI